MWKKTFLYGVLLTIFAIVPFAGGQVNAVTPTPSVRAETVHWHGGGGGWHGGGWRGGGWRGGGWGGGVYVNPYYYGGYYPYYYNNPYYYNGYYGY